MKSSTQGARTLGVLFARTPALPGVGSHSVADEEGPGGGEQMMDKVFRAVVVTLLLVLAVALILLGVWFMILIMEAVGLA